MRAMKIPPLGSHTLIEGTALIIWEQPNLGTESELSSKKLPQMYFLRTVAEEGKEAATNKVLRRNSNILI